METWRDGRTHARTHARELTRSILACLAACPASSGNRQKIIRTGILPHLAGLLVGATDNLGSAQEQEQPEDWEMSSSMDPQVRHASGKKVCVCVCVCLTRIAHLHTMVTALDTISALKACP